MPFKTGIFFLILFLHQYCAIAQYSDGVTGLLHSPSAEMQPDATVMIGGGFLNKQLTPNTNPVAWSYHTYNYYLNATLFPFLEVAYICTLFKRGYKDRPVRWRGQDRHLSFRLRILKEGQMGQYIPAIVLGTADPYTTTQSSYTPGEAGNGHFNRYYIATTKHFTMEGGEVGIHLSYLYNVRKHDKLNGVAWGATYDPDLVKGLRLLAEYDSKDLYVGIHYKVIRQFMLQVMLQNGRYFSGGLTYLIALKK